MKRRAISAAIAAAFAWVLWAEYHATWGGEYLLIPNKWRIVNAFETKNNCDAEQHAHMEDMTGQGWRLRGSNAADRKVKKLLVTYRYLCLPGMLDPRPRK